MQTPDLTENNITKIAQLFPNVITEKESVDGVVEKAVDFELLKQALSKELVEDDNERYRLDWPGKKASLLKANTPITKTLRPDRESSVNFDTTENVFIEGDNFEVLKILQESYLGKVKMIYIDPPYNTGKDSFVYSDNFAQSKEDEDEEIGVIDADGNKLFRNTESNGRFHSDWLSMMYERLLVARDLLRDDGIIFLSIDDNEVHNLRKILDEIFGTNNFILSAPTIMNLKGNQDEFAFAGTHEYTLVYAKQKENLKVNEFNVDEEEILNEWLEDDIGPYKKGANLKSTGANAPRSKRPNLFYPIFVDSNLNIYVTEDDKPKNQQDKTLLPVTGGVEMSWRWQKSKVRNEIGDVILVEDGIGGFSLYKKQRPSIGEMPSKKPKSFFYKPEYSSGNGTNEFNSVLNISSGNDMRPKPVELILDFIHLGTNKNNDIILDFFAGSSTTAHAVMQLNVEDGGNRKFVMVQIPEKINDTSEVSKAGYMYISDISKKRIHLAGKKILEENAEAIATRDKPLDIGFRAYKADTTNMKDVYYHPSQVVQEDLFNLVSNIKEDRTPEDLLTQVILDLGLTLDLPIEKKELRGNAVYFVAGNALVACFDDKIDFGIVDDIATYEPLKVVFKDASFKEEQDRTNVDTRMKRLSPETIITVL